MTAMFLLTITDEFSSVSSRHETIEEALRMTLEFASQNGYIDEAFTLDAEDFTSIDQLADYLADRYEVHVRWEAGNEGGESATVAVVDPENGSWTLTAAPVDLEVARRKLADIRAALAQQADFILDGLAHTLAYLGAKPEWSMEDNFETTEWVASLAAECGLPAASGQTAEALTLYRTAALAAGYDPDDFN